MYTGPKGKVRVGMLNLRQIATNDCPWLRANAIADRTLIAGSSGDHAMECPPLELSPQRWRARYWRSITNACFGFETWMTTNPTGQALYSQSHINNNHAVTSSYQKYTRIIAKMLLNFGLLVIHVENSYLIFVLPRKVTSVLHHQTFTLPVNQMPRGNATGHTTTKNTLRSTQTANYTYYLFLAR